MFWIRNKSGLGSDSYWIVHCLADVTHGRGIGNSMMEDDENCHQKNRHLEYEL